MKGGEGIHIACETRIPAKKKCVLLREKERGGEGLRHLFVVASGVAIRGRKKMQIPAWVNGEEK